MKIVLERRKTSRCACEAATLSFIFAIKHCRELFANGCLLCDTVLMDRIRHAWAVFRHLQRVTVCWRVDCRLVTRESVQLVISQPICRHKRTCVQSTCRKINSSGVNSKLLFMSSDVKLFLKRLGPTVFVCT